MIFYYSFDIDKGVIVVETGNKGGIEDFAFSARKDGIPWAEPLDPDAIFVSSGTRAEIRSALSGQRSIQEATSVISSD